SIRSRTKPALLTRVSSRPKARSAVSTASAAPSAAAMSPVAVAAWPPAARISAATASAGAADRPEPSGSTPTSLTTTRAPCRANSRAWARPSPRPAPVTSTTRPSQIPPIPPPGPPVRSGPAAAAGPVPHRPRTGPARRPFLLTNAWAERKGPEPRPRPPLRGRRVCERSPAGLDRGPPRPEPGPHPPHAQPSGGGPCAARPSPPPRPRRGRRGRGAVFDGVGLRPAASAAPLRPGPFHPAGKGPGKDDGPEPDAGRLHRGRAEKREAAAPGGRPHTRRPLGTAAGAVR